jgi:hypothetical protein
MYTRSRPDGIAPPNAPKLDTPEKLATWIAERKKNWPTPTNIERRVTFILLAVSVILKLNY